MSVGVARSSIIIKENEKQQNGINFYRSYAGIYPFSKIIYMLRTWNHDSGLMIELCLIRTIMSPLKYSKYQGHFQKGKKNLHLKMTMVTLTPKNTVS